MRGCIITIDSSRSHTGAVLHFHTVQAKLSVGAITSLADSRISNSYDIQPCQIHSSAGSTGIIDVSVCSYIDDETPSL